jgi:4'-phosphopantetheinyl transferase
MSRDAPAAGEVQLWWADLDALDPEVDSVLAPDELERAGRMLRGARRFAVRRAVLRLLLGEYGGADPAALRLDAGPHGKPSCPQAPDLAFNYSSSGPVAIYAFARGGRIGVDVEHRPDGAWEELPVRRYLSDRERAALGTSPDELPPPAAAAWVAKEAVAKAVGAGLSRSPVGIELSGDRSHPAVSMVGPWAGEAGASWDVRLVHADARRVAAVATDGDWRRTLTRDYALGVTL